jgi:hypothetical protein
LIVYERVYLTKSDFSSIKVPLEKWIEYAKIMILGLSIRKNTKNVRVSKLRGELNK